MTLEARAQRPIHTNTIDIWLYDPTVGVNGAVGQTIVMNRLEIQGQYAPPTLQLPQRTAQQLIDELWFCGLRPTEGSGSAGSLAATERHLSDMRAMAFASLKIVKP